MDIKLADGTIVKNVPKGVTPEQVQAKFDARKSRDEGIGGMDLVKSLASGVNRLGASLAGMADDSIIGDVFRVAGGTPSRSFAGASSFDPPEIAAKKEKLAEEYLKANPVTKKIQRFFEDNAETWNEGQSAPAKNIRSYVNSGKGFVDTAGRYLKHPSAGVMSAVESLPMMAPLILTKNAPATTQLTLGALHESAANAEDARQSALEDAKRNGATAAQALEASNLARDLAFASTMATMPINAAGGVNALRRLTGRTTTEGAKHGFSQIPKQMLAEAGQEFLQEGSSKVAQNMGAQQTYAPDRNAFEGAAVAGLHGAVAGGIMGGAMGTLAVPEGAAPEADPTPDSPQPTPQASPDAQAAQARKAELDAIRQQRPLTPEEQDDADVADAIISRGAPQGQPVQEAQPAAPVGTNTPPPVEQPPAQPAPGLSGVVQRHTQSAEPSLDAAFSDAIKTGQSPDFAGLAQQTGIDRNSLVDQFNAKRTDHVRKQGLMDLAEQGDLNALRSAASEITVDPQQQDQLIEEAVAGNEQRKAEALAASQQQGAQAQQQAQQSAQQQADKDKYDQTYGKMLDEAVAALEGGQTEVKTFLPIKKKYSASGLNATDVNGVIDHAKQVIAEKQQKAARHEQAVTEAMPHLQSGDEASAVLAMEQAGVTDDADVQSVLKEANKRIRQDSKKPAGTQSVPAGQQAAPVDPLSAAVAEVKAAQAAGKKVNLAAIAKKHGVTIMDVAKGVAAKPEQAAPKANPSQPLALPAPQGPATTGKVMVSRNGKVMSQAEADALDAASTAEKKQMRRDMSEEAGNPTGIPTGMKPKVEQPARAEQKAVLPNLILRTDGKPFPDERHARNVMHSKKLADTHEVVSVEGGKAIAPKNTQSGLVVKNPATGDEVPVASIEDAASKFSKMISKTGADPAGGMDVFDASTGQPVANVKADGTWKAVETVEQARDRSERAVSRMNEDHGKKKPATVKNQVDPEKDDILTAIAKLGGIDREQAKRQGIDPADFNRRAGGIQFVFRKNGGKELDRMAEALSEIGYPVTENGDYTVNALLDSLDAALRGSAVGTPQFHEAQARSLYESEADQAAIDATFDNPGDSAEPDWMSVGADDFVASMLDGDIHPNAVIASELAGIENERTVTGTPEASGQKADANPAPDGGTEGASAVAGSRTERQQEGKGDPQPDTAVQDFGLKAQTEAERLAEEQRVRAALDAKAKADEQARLKAKADKEIDGFPIGKDRLPLRKAIYPQSSPDALIALMEGNKIVFSPDTEYQEEIWIEENKARNTWVVKTRSGGAVVTEGPAGPSSGWSQMDAAANAVDGKSYGKEESKPAKSPDSPSAGSKWDTSTPDARKDILRGAGYTDADQIRGLAYLPWSQVGEAVRKGIDRSAKPDTKPSPSENTVFTEDAAAKARELLKKRLRGNQLNSGLDPEMMQAGITLAGYHIEKGARSFAAYAKAMIEDLGDMVRPYLKSWYMGVKYDPRATGFDGMSSAADVDGFNTDEVTGDDAPKLDTASKGVLAGVSAGEVQRPEAEQSAGAGADGSGRSNVEGDGRVPGAGIQRDGGVGNDTQPVPVSGTGGRERVGGTGRRSGRGTGGTVSEGVSAGNERVSIQGGGRRSGSSDANQPQVALEPGRIDPPQLPDDFIIKDDFGLGEGGQRTKYKQNVEAIKLVKALDAEGRTATTDEQAIIAKYVGWGGIPQAFDQSNSDWSAQYSELKGILTQEEYESARESTQYAHYTSREIIGAMYSALRQFGFTGGNVLEAGGGVGNFIGLMPVEMRTNGKVTLIEREHIASAIARHLYPRQNVRTADFTEFGKGQDNQYDAQIGNPPFSSTPLTDKSGRRHLSGLSVHNYFIAKGIDMLRPGGITAVVVSNSFMDATGDRARKYIGDRAKLLGAIRLPNNAFSKNANTQVTTDIIFLQKLPEAEWGGKSARDDAKKWVETDGVRDPKGGKDIPTNRYFASNPQMMLGQWGRFGTMYGPDQPALVAHQGQNTGDLMEKAVASLPKDVFKSLSDERKKAMEGSLLEKLHDESVSEGGFYVDNGKLWRRINDVVGEEMSESITANTIIFGTKPIGDNGVSRLTQLATMRKTMRSLLAAEIADDTKAMDGLRSDLNRLYDSYVRDNGKLNDPTTKRLMRDDPDYPLLAALEMDYEPGMGPAAAKKVGIKPYSSKAKKAAIFDRRVIEARKPVTTADSPQDAINISMAERGRLDADYVGKLLGIPHEEVLDQLSSGSSPLLFRDPATGEYVLRDAYLSGNVREKLKQAQAAGMSSNARALEEVMPDDVPASQISVRLGSPWVPVDVYRDFAKHLFGGGTKSFISYISANGSFTGTINPESEVIAATKFGTKSYPGDALMLALMNNRQIKVTYRDADGKTHTDQKATEEANAKADEIKQAFQDWAFKDTDRAELMARSYNDANNNYVVRKYDGSWLNFPGKVPDAIITFRRHQRNAIARTVQDRTSLYDHVVGAGKTFTAIASAMELKRTGLANKPMMVVPNHLVGQWAADFYRLYPGAKILAATKKDFERTNRRKFMARIASGDWDAVIIAHSSFSYVKPNPEFELQFNQGQIDGIVREIEAVKSDDGEEQQKKRTVKQLEKLKEGLENKIAKLRDKPMDDLLDFQQLGVDQLFVDEAHLFKNLMFGTKMQNVRGLGDPAGSQRAYDMYLKTRQLMDQNGRGQGVVFMTGTPVSNSLAEMYHMMRYLMPQQMEQLGFDSFDAWANTFASVNQVWMQNASGDGFKAQNRMSSFDNIPELLKMFDQVADTVTMDDIKAAFREENNGKEFPLPALATGRRTPVPLEKSEAQIKYMEEIATRAKALEQRKGPPKKGDDNVLVLMTDARKAAMDIRLVNLDMTEREKGGRIDRASDEIVSRWKKYADQRGAQLVFSDLGTPISSAKAELKEYESLSARINAAADQDVIDRANLGDEAAIDILSDAEDAQNTIEAKGSDWLGSIKAAQRGFSVYDDLKKALVEKGIPENQIAFIHDYNTDDQKAALFRKVNSGEIRVLVGSTPKMGAGTNVQKRLVALHHLDVPWKPSDLEQREGRIIRQGNELADTIPGFEVEIMAYVTKDTLDMRMWQIQETKLKMINQLRSRQIDRDMENAFEEMEMSAGEMQAAATGNMDLLREIQLRTEVQKLEKKQRAFDAGRADVISGLRRAKAQLESLPEQIRRAKALADGADKVRNLYLEHVNSFKATINGKDYTDRTAASQALRDMTEAVETGDDGKERKAKLDVTLNGEHYTNRQKLAEAFARLTGDREPFVFEVDGEVMYRLEDASDAILDDIEAAKESNAPRVIGSMGPFTVSIEYEGVSSGNRDEFNVYAEIGDADVSAVVRGSEDDRAIGRNIVRAVRDMVRDAPNGLDSEMKRLEKAKKTVSDYEKIDTSEAWPDGDKLESLRAEHRAILDRMNSSKPEEGQAANDGDKKLSVGEGSGPALTTTHAREVLSADPVLSKALPFIEVKNSRDGVPAGAEAIGAEGYYHNGKVTLFADNIKANATQTADERLKWVAFHEITHRGVANLAESREYMAELQQAGKNPFIKSLAKKIYAKRLGTPYEVSMDVAVEEALAEANAALQTGSSKTIKAQYGLHFPLAIRGRAKSAIARFFEAVKRIYSKVVGRGLTNEQVADLLRKTHDAGMGPGDGPKGGKKFSAPPTDGASLTISEAAGIVKEWMFSAWTKSLGTQLNTAMLEPLFKPTYDLVQRYLQHTSNDAYDAISVAPNLLGRLEDINDYKRDIKNIANYGRVKADREAAAVPLFEGTRFDKKVYSDAVLKRVFNLTDDQVAVYREARAAIEASLDSHAKSVITKILLDAGAVEFSDIDTLVNRDLPADDYMEELRQRLDADILAANDAIAIQKTALSAAGVTAQDKSSIEAKIKKGERDVGLLEEAAKRIDSTENTLSQLKREGYFPLMRWGKYSVTVKDAGGKVVDFRMVDGIFQRMTLKNALTKQYQGQGMTVTSGTMDEGRFKDFRGMSPETLALFAKELGVDNDEAYQEYLKLALPGQSALKRRIHRKGDNGEGIAGFSMDIQRTLASFVMGNARHSARNIYGSAITKSVDSIPGERGDVRGLARNLAEFVTQPDENSTSVSIRNMLFIWNMGFSVAFASLNLTQPWMMTLPWLSQFSGIGSVVELMGKAAKTAATAQYDGAVPPEYYAEYQRAKREGLVDPQNVFMLQGVERGNSGVGSGVLKTMAHGMGIFSSVTESYNRKLTLFAALDVARAKGLPWLKSKGFDSAYDFAKQAIAETQGVYNKGNRPAWARGQIGAILLVFKQYAVNWIEMAVRMGRNHYGDDRMRKGLMMMLGLLFAMAGGLGMPFADDLKDIAETAMGSLGKPVNIERQMQMTLGKGMADAVLAGPMNAMVLNGLGLDMQGRMSMGNLIPITGAFNPYTPTDAKLSEGISVMGAGTGLLKKGSDAVAAAQDGRYLDAAQSASPRAVESLMKGVRMLAEGKARDTRGNVLMETTRAEAIAKILDFQPARVAVTQRERGRRYQDKNIQMVARASLRNRLITAYEEKDAEKIRDAEQALDEWNQDNPLYQIKLKKRDLRRAAKKRGSSWMKREETPKGLEWMDEYAEAEE